MSETDRERLERLAQENEKARVESKAAQGKKQAEIDQRNADQSAEDRQKTMEILETCKEFNGFKLVPTGHEVTVNLAPSSRFLNREPDGIEYVSFNVSHSDDRSNFQGQLSVLLARFRKGKYDVVDSSGESHFYKTLADTKEGIIKYLSGLGSDELGKLLEVVRRHWSSH